MKHSDAFVLEELEKKAKTISEHVTTNAKIWNRGQYKQSELYSHQRVVLFSDVLALLGAREKELRSKLVRLNQMRAGSVFSNHMEFGMEYMILVILGEDVSQYIKDAKKWKRKLMDERKKKREALKPCEECLRKK